MEYSIGFKDILVLVRRGLKFVVIMALIFALLFTGLGVLKMKSDSSNIAQLKADEDLAGEKDKVDERAAQIRANLEIELIEANKDLEKNPIMKQDPNNCKCRKLSFTFAGENDKTSAVQGWIDGIRTKQLFGIRNKTLAKFRRSIVSVNGINGEVDVYVFPGPKYKYSDVADKVYSRVMSRARERNMNISNSSNNVLQGYNQKLFDLQDTARNNVIRIQSRLGNFRSLDTNTLQVLQADSAANNLSLFLYILAGLFAGAALAIAYIVIKALRRGIMLSKNQVEELFAIEKVSTVKGSAKDEAASVDAIVDMLGNEKDVVILGKGESTQYENIAKEIDSAAERSYEYADIDTTDVNVLKKLKEDVAVIIPVTIGETTYGEIKETIRWSRRFEKDLIGYLLVEQEVVEGEQA